MTLHQLKIFELVATHLSITKAARLMRISQPSISRQLRLLEEDCGVKFHAKIGGGIRLTEQGRLFWNSSRPILQQIDDLEKSFINRPHERKLRCLKIGGTPSPSSFLLPRALKAFKETFPDVQIVYQTADKGIIEQMVLDSTLEIGLVTSQPPHNPKIAAEAFRSEELVAVVSPTHPLAEKRKLSVEELANVPVLLRTGGRIMKQLQQKGFKLNNIIMACESTEAIISAVQAGLGIGFFLRDNAELGLKKGYLKTIEIPLLREIDLKCFIIYRNDEPLSPTAKDFLTLLWKQPRKAVISKQAS